MKILLAICEKHVKINAYSVANWIREATGFMHTAPAAFAVVERRIALRCSLKSQGSWVPVKLREVWVIQLLVFIVFAPSGDT